METAVAAQSEIEQQLTAATDTVRQQELGLAKAESAVKSAEANRKRSQHDRHALHKEYQSALAERKQSTKKQLTQLDNQISKAKSNFETSLTEVDDQLQEALGECAFHWEQVVDDLIANRMNRGDR